MCNFNTCFAGLSCVGGICLFGGGSTTTGDGDGDGDGDETGGPTGTDSGGCDPGEIDCDGTCIDPDSDAQNCGECGNACMGACVNGVCEDADCMPDACPDGTYCDPDTNQCAPGCDTDFDCLQGSCDLATNTCGLGEGEPCDVCAQNCLPGFKCDPDNTPPSCTELPPDPDALGQACTLLPDSCDVGLYCLYTGINGVGECYPLCGGSEAEPTCMGGGQICADVGTPLCLETCDPFVQDCGSAEGCYPVFGEMDFACVPATTGLGLGESCSYLNDCAAGLACYSEEVGCAEFCEVANPPPDCECVEMFDGIGLCFTP